MYEVKDPKIKLFGKTIELPEAFSAAAEISEAAHPPVDENNCSNRNPPFPSNSMLGDSNFNGEYEDDHHQSQSCQKQDDTKDKDQHQKPSSSNELKDSNIPPPFVDDSKEEALKKPDKILSCPRCNSTDTKFCYFNNYNVKQPRHFCRNCQRYWTAGGTMRNVPVGAGRRKNKITTASQFRPLCESTVSGFNIVDKEIGSRENGDDRSTGSSTSLRIPVFRRPPWPYPWFNPNSGPASLSLPAPSYWDCGARTSVWNVPFVMPPTKNPSAGPNSPTLGKRSRDDNVLKLVNLEEEGQKESNSEKCLWVPKTLRINDRGGGDKSCRIWAKLGIKNDYRDDYDYAGVGGGGSVFKAFQRRSKGGDEKNEVNESSTALQANPAALSRSVSFHESS